MAHAHPSVGRRELSHAVLEIQRKLPGFLAHFKEGTAYAVQKVGRFGGARVYYNVLTGRLAWNELPPGTTVKEYAVARAIARAVTETRRRPEFRLLSAKGGRFRAVQVGVECRKRLKLQ